jgi:hypothetical protein
MLPDDHIDRVVRILKTIGKRPRAARSPESIRRPSRVPPMRRAPAGAPAPGFIHPRGPKGHGQRFGNALGLLPSGCSVAGVNPAALAGPADAACPGRGSCPGFHPPAWPKGAWATIRKRPRAPALGLLGRRSQSGGPRGSRRCGVPRPGLLPRVSSTRVARRGMGNDSETPSGSCPRAARSPESIRRPSRVPPMRRAPAGAPAPGFIHPRGPKGHGQLLRRVQRRSSGGTCQRSASVASIARRSRRRPSCSVSRSSRPGATASF